MSTSPIDPSLTAPPQRDRAASARGGFTLVELMVVVTIIAVLAALGTFAYGKITRRARLNEAVSFLSAVHAGQALYYSGGNGYCNMAADVNSPADGDWDPPFASVQGTAVRWDSPDPTWAQCLIRLPTHTWFSYIMVAEPAGNTHCAAPADIPRAGGGTVAIPACDSVETDQDWYYVVGRADQDSDGFFSLMGSSSEMIDRNWTVSGIELE